MNRDRKKLWWAVIGSLFVHLLVAFSVAALNQSLGPTPPLQEGPVELTMIDMSAAPAAEPVPPNPAYIETDPGKESVTAPEDKTFESNANSIAASNAPASGDAPLPSQEGEDRPFMDMQTQRYSIPSEGSQAQPEAVRPPPEATPAPTAMPTPTAQPSEPPKPTPMVIPTPEPVPPPEPEQFAMLTATPPPALRDPEDTEASPPPEVALTPPPLTARPRPESPAAGYQPEKQETRISGRITNRGVSAVDAVETPLGKYQKAVSDAIGSLWYYHIKQNGDLASIGTAYLEAEVDSAGKIRNLRVRSNSANEAFVNICLQSFQEAKIPPIPPDLVATLPEGRLPVEFSFTYFAN
ncbi:MAG: hypothetical protein ABR589_01025 [Chthoniobacterales bacterium]